MLPMSEDHTRDVEIELSHLGSVRTSESVIKEDTHLNMKGIGFCPQFEKLWPSLTVNEHFQYYTRMKGIGSSKTRRAYIAKLLQSVGLADSSDVPAQNLSGGLSPLHEIYYCC